MLGLIETSLDDDKAQAIGVRGQRVLDIAAIVGSRGRGCVTHSGLGQTDIREEQRGTQPDGSDGSHDGSVVSTPEVSGAVILRVLPRWGSTTPSPSVPARDSVG